METPLQLLISKLKAGYSAHNQNITHLKSLKQKLADRIRFLTPYELHTEGTTSGRDDSISSVNAIPRNPKLKKLLETPKYEEIPIEHGMKSTIATTGQFNHLTKRSDTELFNILKNTLNLGLWGEKYKRIAGNIVNHLKTGDGKDFVDTNELSTQMVIQEPFRSLIKEISASFIGKMALSKNDFSLIHELKEGTNKNTGLQNFPFGITYNENSTLKVLVGGVQELHVYLKIWSTNLTKMLLLQIIFTRHHWGLLYMIALGLMKPI